MIGCDGLDREYFYNMLRIFTDQGVVKCDRRCAGCCKSKNKRGGFFNTRVDPAPVFRRGRAPVDKRESIQ
jgi:hypothetical protein